MYLKNLNGEVIYEGRSYILSSLVVEAIENNIDLSAVNLRGARLKNINLNGVNLNGACFWGASLQNVDLSNAKLNQADFRNSKIINCPFLQARCANANFLGTSFDATDFTQCDLSNTKFSDVSILYQNIQATRNLKGAVYSHRGEVEYDLLGLVTQYKKTDDFIAPLKSLLNQNVGRADLQNAKKTRHIINR